MRTGRRRLSGVLESRVLALRSPWEASSPIDVLPLSFCSTWSWSSLPIRRLVPADPDRLSSIRTDFSNAEESAEILNASVPSRAVPPGTASNFSRNNVGRESRVEMDLHLMWPPQFPSDWKFGSCGVFRTSNGSNNQTQKSTRAPSVAVQREGNPWRREGEGPLHASKSNEKGHEQVCWSKMG